MEENISEISSEVEKQLLAISDFIDYLKSFVTPANIVKFVGAFLAVCLVLGIYKGIKIVFKRTAAKKMSENTASIVLRLVKYLFYLIVTMIVLNMFGISLTAIWGAAGIAGVALGFAAQTSVSNLISGLFVVTEKTMKHGDYIEVDGVTGTIDEIGLLAIRIHTPNNQQIRIPNSTIINSKLINYSTNPMRRYVFEIGVGYGVDLNEAIELLKTVPAMCKYAVTDKKDYEPKVLCAEVGDSAINLNLIVWCKRQNFLALKSEVCINSIKVLNDANVDIPYTRLEVAMMGENA